MTLTDDAELPILPIDIEFHPGVIQMRNDALRMKEALREIVRLDQVRSVNCVSQDDAHDGAFAKIARAALRT